MILLKFKMSFFSKSMDLPKENKPPILSHKPSNIGIRQGCFATSVFIDFSKTFDLVGHSIQF